MKTSTKFLNLSFAALACCLFVIASSARADDDVQGGDIDGTESLDVDIEMMATTAAPAGSSIDLELESDDDEGVTDSILKLETQGLPASTYSVTTTLKSDGSMVALGTFTIDTNNDGEIEFSTQPEDGDEAPFPANFNPMDIATVSVLDASNTVIFTADLTNIATIRNLTINGTVRGMAGPVAPSATGTATLSALVVHNAGSGNLQLTASGLPVSTPLTFAVNGVKSKKVTTDKNGNASVRMFAHGKNATVAPKVSVISVKSVSLTDKAHNILLHAGF